MIRNVLALNDVAQVPETGGQVLVLATDGAIDILPTRGRSKRLQSGESAIFNAEGLEIKVSEESAYGVPTNQLGSLTNMLQTDDPMAGYVVVVIGPEVPKTGEPTATSTATTVPPTSTLIPTSAPPTEAPVEPTNTPDVLGSVGVTGRLCRAGITAANASDTACPILPDGFDMQLSGPSGTYALGNANRIDASWYWTELATGTWTLATTAYPANANDYFIAGSAAIGGSSQSGYSVTIDPSSPNIVAQVYYLQPAAQTTSAVTVVIAECAQGPNGPVECGSPSNAPLPYLVSSQGASYTWSDAKVVRNTYTWNLPAGTWTLYQDGWQGDFYVNGVRYDAGTAYIFSSDGANAVRIDVQNVYFVIQ
jgi:hypothetical protein